MARRYASSALIRASRGPVPTVYRCNMRYVQVVQLNATDSAAAISVFRCNSIFDPDFTGAGHQPYGRDQLAALYQRYLVTGSKITATAISRATTAASANQVVFINTSSSSSISDIAGVLEQPNTQMAVMGSANGATPNVTLTANYSASKFHNVKDPFAEDTLQATMGANPGLAAFFCVGSAPVNFGVDDPATIDVLVTIDFAVACLNPIVLSSS